VSFFAITPLTISPNLVRRKRNKENLLLRGCDAMTNRPLVDKIHFNSEVELKHFVASPQDLLAIYHSLHQLDCETKATDFSTVFSAYYDTDDHKIFRSRATLRTRWGTLEKLGNQISVKTHGEVTKNGAINRDEYEFPLADKNKIDLLSITHPDARALLPKLNEQDLHKIFTTDVDRQAIDLTFTKNNKTFCFEVALDELRYFLADNKTDTPDKIFYEFEIEYHQRRSSPTATYDEIINIFNLIVAHVKTALPDMEMTLNKLSKAEIGFKLDHNKLNQACPVPSKALCCIPNIVRQTCIK